jgi:glycosyltransferase involved in cell wall biosynthesis
VNHHTAGPVPVVRIIARTNVGGPALQVTALMRGLPVAQYPQTLLRGQCAADEDDYLDLVATDVPSTTVIGLGRSVRPLDDLRALRTIVRELRRQRPLIVHTHTAKAGVLGRLAAIVARVPIRVHTFHGHVLHGYFGRIVSKGVAVLEWLLGRATTHIVAVGDQTLADLAAAHIVRPGRSSVIAPGVREGRAIAPGEARATLGLPTDGLIVTFAGRLTAIKRPERVLELARSVADTHPHVHIAIAGDGALRAELEAGAPANVTFLGMCDDITLVLRASDLVVLTSDNEGMPVALIEAAMHGLPAVTTDAGSVRQVVVDGQTGLVVPIGDTAALHTAVAALLDDPARRAELGAAARVHAQAHFGEARLVDDYRRLYDTLVAAHTARRPGRRASRRRP